MKVYLVSAQILYALFLMPWLLIWGLTFMGFASGINWFSASLTVGIGLYPVAVIVCSIIAWRLRNKRKRTAMFVNLVPMIWILAVGVPFAAINL